MKLQLMKQQIEEQERKSSSSNATHGSHFCSSSYVNGSGGINSFGTSAMAGGQSTTSGAIQHQSSSSSSSSSTTATNVNTEHTNNNNMGRIFTRNNSITNDELLNSLSMSLTSDTMNIPSSYTSSEIIPRSVLPEVFQVSQIFVESVFCFARFNRFTSCLD